MHATAYKSSRGTILPQRFEAGVRSRVSVAWQSRSLRQVYARIFPPGPNVLAEAMALTGYPSLQTAVRYFQTGAVVQFPEAIQTR
jgi:hypothetical protein